MKILLTKDEIDTLNEELFDALFLIRSGINFIDMYFETKEERLRYVYGSVVTGMIKKGKREYDVSQLKSSNMYSQIYDIRLSLIYYENDYEKFKRDRYLSGKINILNYSKLVLEDGNYFLNLDIDYAMSLKYILELYIGCLLKNKKKFIKLFRSFYEFDVNQENFEEYLNIYLNILGEYKYRKKLIKYKKILKKIKQIMSSEEVESEINERIKIFTNEVSTFVKVELLHQKWLLGKRVDEENGATLNIKCSDEIYSRIAKEAIYYMGRGFGKKNIKLMHRFYLFFPNWDSINKDLLWEHYKELLKVKDDKLRTYYLNYVIKNNLSVDELKKIINEKKILKRGS
ncbi:MAG: DUF1016 domain-containing protein [Erysipelotrichaceae bacterium]|nr:DUF1016 domain-containing protein [Erysipelotrichaceae bacterium]